MATIGFVGLGIMGAHMARNLLRGDHTLIVSGKHSVPEDLRSRATVVANSAAVAQAADIVIAMVPDTADVADVLFGEAGVAQRQDGPHQVLAVSHASGDAVHGDAQRRVS